MLTCRDGMTYTSAPSMSLGFLDKAKAAQVLAAEAKVAAQNRSRDEALAQHVLRTRVVAGFQQPAAAPQGLVEVLSAVLAVAEAEPRWHEHQIPAAPDEHPW